MLGGPRRSVLLAAAVAALMTSASATPGGRAAPLAGPEVRISGPGATGLDWSPEIAANDTDDEYLVVWADNRDPQGAIYARRVSPDGAPIGLDRRVSGPNAVAPGLPDVAWNSAADEYLVVWEDGRNGDTDIYSVRLSRTGARLAPDRKVSGFAAAGARFPAVEYGRSSGLYVVVWEDHRTPARGTDVYGRRVGGDGVPLGKDLRVSGPGATGDDSVPAIAWAWTGNDTFLVVWSDRRNPARGNDVFGRRLTPNGYPIGTDRRISASGNGHNEWEPAIGWSTATDEYLVVWEDDRRSAQRGTDVYGKRVSQTGALLGGDFRISGPLATADDSDPGVGYSSRSSEFLVVWSDARNYSKRAEDLYGRIVTGAGVVSGGDFRISGAKATGAESDPRVGFQYDAARYLVVWADDRTGARGYDVFGRPVAG